MKYRADSSAKPTGHDDATFIVVQVQLIANERSEPGPDLRDGPFPPARPAGSDSKGRREELDNRHARANPASVPVIGFDGGVGTMSLCLGGKGVHQKPADQPSDDRNQYQQPGSERLRSGG